MYREFASREKCSTYRRAFAKLRDLNTICLLGSERFLQATLGVLIF